MSGAQKFKGGAKAATSSKNPKTEFSSEISDTFTDTDRPQVTEELDPSAEIHAYTKLKDNTKIELPNSNFKASGNSIPTKES